MAEEWERKEWALSEGAVRRLLREDPWKDYPVVGDRVLFRPDDLELTVTRFSPGQDANRWNVELTNPYGTKTVLSLGDYLGMIGEGTFVRLED